MKIVIATGVYPPDIGGPAQYAYHLARTFKEEGHTVEVVSYRVERKLPIGIRHLYYFFRLVPRLAGVDFILALDTFSVGVPALAAAALFGKKLLVRVGGDFLWESYIERTGHPIPLSRFYDEDRPFSLKEKVICMLSSLVFHHAHALVFNTSWQKYIVNKAYHIDNKKSFVVGNYIAPKAVSYPPTQKNFICAVRPIKLKNRKIVEEIFEELTKTHPQLSLDITLRPHHELMDTIAHAYAVILPSLSDVYPNLILDAIRHNKPFICTKESGITGEFKDIGIFVDPLDKEQIREKILFLSDEKNYAVAVQKLSLFNKTHSWKEICQEFIEISKNI